MNVTNGVFEITLLLHEAAEERRKAYQEFLERMEQQCQYWEHRLQQSRVGMTLAEAELMAVASNLQKYQKARDNLKRMVGA